MNLTREQILAEPAGRQMDKWVAEYVMGLPALHDHEIDEQEDCWYEYCKLCGFEPRCNKVEPGTCEGYKRYSTGIAAAWEVVEKMRRDGKDIALFTGVVPGMWACAIGKLDYKNKKPIVDDTAPLAICRAALLAKLEEANA